MYTPLHLVDPEGVHLRTAARRAAVEHGLEGDGTLFHRLSDVNMIRGGSVTSAHVAALPQHVLM